MDRHAKKNKILVDLDIIVSYKLYYSQYFKVPHDSGKQLSDMTIEDVNIE